MKKWISIIAIMLVVVCAAGCVDSSPKTYTGNGISFQYPADWSTDYKNNFSDSFGSDSDVLASFGKDDSGVVVLKSKALVTGVTANELGNAFKSAMQSGGYTVVSDKARTVGGANAYELVVQDKNSSTTFYASFTVLIKDKYGYIILAATPNNDQETFDLILNSFKFT